MQVEGSPEGPLLGQGEGPSTGRSPFAPHAVDGPTAVCSPWQVVATLTCQSGLRPAYHQAGSVLPVHQLASGYLCWLSLHAGHTLHPKMMHAAHVGSEGWGAGSSCWCMQLMLGSEGCMQLMLGPKGGVQVVDHGPIRGLYSRLYGGAAAAAETRPSSLQHQGATPHATGSSPCNPHATGSSPCNRTLTNLTPHLTPDARTYTYRLTNASKPFA